jgi:hypothetical protein
MHIAFAIAITTLVVYPVGVLTAKWVLLESETIKAHVSGEIDGVKNHFVTELEAIHQKLNLLLKR